MLTAGSDGLHRAAQAGEMLRGCRGVQSSELSTGPEREENGEGNREGKGREGIIRNTQEHSFLLLLNYST